MKKIGLVGGIGPASTVDYYLGLIERCRAELGENVYPEIVIDSVSLTTATDFFAQNDFDGNAQLMLKSLADLKAAGAEIAAITANTEHIVWDKIKDFFEIPVVSIVEATAAEILRKGYKRVLILGTIFTMKSGLYEKPLIERGITPIIPKDEDKEKIANLFFPNLENGIVIAEDKAKMLEIVGKIARENSADAVLLGCTELPLMIKDGDIALPLLNTTQIHINAIFDAAK